MSARKVGTSLFVIAASLAVVSVASFLLAVWTGDGRWEATGWTLSAASLVALIAASCPAWWFD